MEKTLEEEFKEHVAKVREQIFDKLDAARELIKIATDLAEANAVPFRHDVSLCTQNYIPTSINAKNKYYAELSREVLEEVTGCYELSGALTWGGGGWEQSMVCN